MRSREILGGAIVSREVASLMRRMARRMLGLVFLLLPVAVAGRLADKPEAPPVAATIETSLTTDSTHIRQFALDGDSATFFASAQNAGRSDHFSLVFERPVAMESIAIATGRSDGGDRLKAVTIEVSIDGSAFDPPRPLADGQKLSDAIGPKLKAVRFRPVADLKHPLAIREITITSVPAVAVFQYPVEFVVDVADAPEMKAWAEKTARVCEGAYAMINRELESDGFKPATLIKMSLKKSYRGVAAAGGGEITGSAKYFKDHPRDIGAMVHETVHIVQHYRSRGNPGWLVEGVADYVRFFKFEPGNLGPINPARAHYNQSYRVSAAFLAYLVDKYDPKIVLKLNQAMREGTYKSELFQQLTAKNVDDLGKEWRAKLQDDERARTARDRELRQNAKGTANR
jgi:hypothetical protein